MICAPHRAELPWPSLHGHYPRLVAGAPALIVVQEFQQTFGRLHGRHVGRRTNVERTAVVDGSRSSPLDRVNRQREGAR